MLEGYKENNIMATPSEREIKRTEEKPLNVITAKELTKMGSTRYITFWKLEYVRRTIEVARLC